MLTIAAGVFFGLVLFAMFGGLFISLVTSKSAWRLFLLSAMYLAAFLMAPTGAVVGYWLGHGEDVKDAVAQARARAPDDIRLYDRKTGEPVRYKTPAAAEYAFTSGVAAPKKTDRVHVALPGGEVGTVLATDLQGTLEDGGRFALPSEFAAEDARVQAERETGPTASAGVVVGLLPGALLFFLTRAAGRKTKPNGKRATAIAATLLLAGCSGSSIPDLGGYDAGLDANVTDAYVDSGQDAGLDTADAADSYDANDGWRNPLDLPCDLAEPADSGCVGTVRAPGLSDSAQLSCISYHTPNTPHDMYARCSHLCELDGPKPDWESTCAWLGGECLQPASGYLKICVPKP